MCTTHRGEQGGIHRMTCKDTLLGTSGELNDSGKENGNYYVSSNMGLGSRVRGT